MGHASRAGRWALSSDLSRKYRGQSYWAPLLVESCAFLCIHPRDPGAWRRVARCPLPSRWVWEASPAACRGLRSELCRPRQRVPGPGSTPDTCPSLAQRSVAASALQGGTQFSGCFLTGPGLTPARPMGAARPPACRKDPHPAQEVAWDPAWRWLQPSPEEAQAQPGSRPREAVGIRGHRGRSLWKHVPSPLLTTHPVTGGLSLTEATITSQ